MQCRKEKTNKKEMNIKRMFVVLDCLQIIYWIIKYKLKYIYNS